MESMPSMPQFTMLSMLPHSFTTLPQLLPTLSMPESTMPSTLLQLIMPQLSTLPQLTMPQSRLDMSLMTLLSLPHTLTPTLLLMTTLVLLSTRLRTMMEPVLLMENTLSTFLMAESNMLSITPMTMMVLSLMSPMRESHTMLLLPQLLMPSMPQLLPMLSMPQLLPMLSMPQFSLMVSMPQLLLTELILLVKLNQQFQYLLQLPTKPIFIDIYR